MQSWGRANAIWRKLSVLGRFALIVSLWHAPLPILHAHDADIAHSQVPEALVDHLVEYHPDVFSNSPFELGWHWHLVLPPAGHPGDQSPEGDCPFCPLDSPLSLPQVQLPVATTLSLDLGMAFVWHSMAHVAIQLPRWSASEPPTRFLDTYLGSVSLGTLLRVARC